MTNFNTSAVCIGGICILSLCFEPQGEINDFVDLGIGTIGVRSAQYVNTVLFEQGIGDCIDCYIGNGDNRVYVNARGKNSPAKTALRGTLIFPIKQ